MVDIYHLIADIWVARDSYIYKLENRAKPSHIYLIIGAKNVQNVKWIKPSGMNWQQLQQKFSSRQYKALLFKPLSFMLAQMILSK